MAVAQPGFITTVAGTSVEGYNGDGIAATFVQLRRLLGVDVDAAGDLFISAQKSLCEMSTTKRLP